MGGVVQTVSRVFNPPKVQSQPVIMQAAAEQNDQLAVQERALQDQRADLTARETQVKQREDAGKAATQRARAGAGGRVLLLNDEIGVPQNLQRRLGG
jgi:hypothetical protein